MLLSTVLRIICISHTIKLFRTNSRYFYFWWWLKEKGLLLCFSLLHHLPQCPLRSSSTCVSPCWMLFWPTSAPQCSTIPCTGPSCRRWPRFTGSPSRQYHGPQGLIAWGKTFLWKLFKNQMGFWMGMTCSFSFCTCEIFNECSAGTFSPGAFVGCVLHRAPIASPRKRKYEEDERQTIPNVLQGEVARLNPKFLVNLDPSHCSNNGTVHLICKLGKKKEGDEQSGSSLRFTG